MTGPNSANGCGLSLRTLALFAGVGGIECGLTSAGHEMVAAVEVDDAAQAVLRFRFPGVPIEGDVSSLTSIDPSVDLVAAGFPCVDLSQVGRTSGLDGASSGLIRHALKVICASKVKYVFLENVPFMLRLGKGRAMQEIASKLEEAGYQWAYRTVDARSFGLPQRRPRVLVIASLDRDPRNVLFRQSHAPSRTEERPAVGVHSIGFYSTEGNRGSGLVADAIPPLKPGSKLGIKSSPAILLPDGSVGTPTIEDAERLQGLEAGWTEPAATIGRNARWRLVGNAVNVKVSKWVGDGLANADSVPAGLPGAQPVESGRWPTAAWNVGAGRFGCNLAPHFGDEPPTPIADFLSSPLEPLSNRACRGFVERAEKSALRFPEGFLKALRAYLLTAD